MPALTSVVLMARGVGSSAAPDRIAIGGELRFCRLLLYHGGLPRPELHWSEHGFQGSWLNANPGGERGDDVLH